VKILPRMIEYTVSVAIKESPLLPVPYANPGTRMSLTRGRVTWLRAGNDPWRLSIVTVYGAASTGDGITVDYFPDNPMKQPPRELSEWIASTDPRRMNEEQTA